MIAPLNRFQHFKKVIGLSNFLRDDVEAFGRELKLFSHLKFPLAVLTNERDFPVPSKPRPVGVAVYGN